jgi:Double zinc ribbon
MHCPHCANDIPDGSKFCNHCGTPPQAPIGTKGTNSGLMFLAGLAVAGIIAGGVYLLQTQTQLSTTPPTKTVLAAQPAPVLQPHNETIVDTAFTVESGKWTAYKFEVPAGARNVKVTGHFTASGGAKNSIEVFLTNDDGIANLKNRNPYKKFYSSGRITQNSLNVFLPPAPDTYYLVFDNRFALLIPRAVKADATVSYLQ